MLQSACVLVQERTAPVAERVCMLHVHVAERMCMLQSACACARAWRLQLVEGGRHFGLVRVAEDGRVAHDKGAKLRVAEAEPRLHRVQLGHQRALHAARQGARRRANELAQLRWAEPEPPLEVRELVLHARGQHAQ